MQCVLCEIKIVCLLNITMSAAEVTHSPINEWFARNRNDYAATNSSII
jgi:hypothetical protein